MQVEFKVECPLALCEELITISWASGIPASQWEPPTPPEWDIKDNPCGHWDEAAIERRSDHIEALIGAWLAFQFEDEAQAMEAAYWYDPEPQPLEEPEDWR